MARAWRRPDAFLEQFANVARLETTAFDTDELAGETPLAVVPASP